MSQVISPIQNPSVAAPTRPLQKGRPETELEGRTTAAAASALAIRTETSESSLHPDKVEIIPTKPEPSAHAHLEIHESVPGAVKGGVIAVVQPAATGHIDEAIFAKQTAAGKPQKTFSQKISESFLFPFNQGKYIANVSKSAAKYGVLYGLTDYLKPSIKRALPDNTPGKELIVTSTSAALGALAETVVSAPLSVCIAAKRTDNNEGKPVRTCRQIFKEVKSENRIGHFFPKEAIKWNLARNVLFAVPLFTFSAPATAYLERTFGYSQENRPNALAKMGIDMAANGVVSSVSSACSFWTDTIATRCTQTPGLSGREELAKILKKEGLLGTVRQLNNGLSKAFIRMGIVGVVVGGVTAGLEIGYKPTKKALLQGLEGARTSLAALNDETDLEEASGFLSRAWSALSSFLNQSSTETPAETSTVCADTDEGLLCIEGWVPPSGNRASEEASTETPTVSADTNEGLLFSEGWVPPSGNRASEEASTQQSTSSPAADEPLASSSSSHFSDYVTDSNF